MVRNWLRTRTTLEFLSTWEEIYNPDFKVFESEHLKKQAGLLTFTPSVSEWIEQTGAIGLFVKKGRYGGTFAHKGIAFEFASAISPECSIIWIYSKSMAGCKSEIGKTHVSIHSWRVKFVKN